MIAFDWETHLIAPARQIPPGVCLSYAEIDGNAIARAGVLSRSDGLAYLESNLRRGASFVGANTAFDVLVSVFSADARWHEVLTLWVEAYESGRVRDVLVRQKLLDLAAGCYRYDPRSRQSYRYSLADVARRYTKRELDKANPWRLRFAELDGLPVEQYPPDALAYSLDDAVATAEVYLAQHNHDRRIAENFPGMDPLADEVRQTIACVPLRAISAYGLRTDPAAVERLREDVTALHAEVREGLLAAGLIRREVSRDMLAIANRCELHGVPSARKADLLASGDPLLRKLALDWRGHAEELATAGLVKIEYKRNTKAAAARCAAAYRARGQEPPLTKHNQIALDVDACERSEDPLLADYAEYSSLAKTLSTDLKFLAEGARIPVHSRFEELLETGRTSSSKPNIQNIRRLPGIRECFVPRPGHVFLDADYPMLELHTLAQVCFWVFGYSTLGEALKAGQDPHLQMAATILGRPYDELKARRAQGDPVVDNARTAGKGVNFGAPGGLGPETFTRFAWKSYRIRLTKVQAKKLINQYKDTWTEMRHYFKWIESLARGDSYNVVQPWSQRLRAGASYCSACNSPFQGLGADVAKVALWLVWKATVGLSERGFNDPLYGAHMVNFVHDSIMVEVLEDRAHAAADRLKELMHAAAVFVMPNVGMREIDVLATRQWSKKAQALRDAQGRFIPWDLREACAAALAKAQPLERAAAFDYLTGKDWPRDVARETIAEFYGGTNVIGVCA